MRRGKGRMYLDDDEAGAAGVGFGKVYIGLVAGDVEAFDGGGSFFDFDGGGGDGADEGCEAEGDGCGFHCDGCGGSDGGEMRCDDGEGEVVLYAWRMGIGRVMDGSKSKNVP